MKYGSQEVAKPVARVVRFLYDSRRSRIPQHEDVSVDPWIVDWHYADPKFRPGAREFELAQIFERTGRTKEAEEHYQRAIQPGKVDGHLFLGDFYERQQRVESAIRTFETALLLAEDEPPL